MIAKDKSAQMMYSGLAIKIRWSQFKMEKKNVPANSTKMGSTSTILMVNFKYVVARQLETRNRFMSRSVVICNKDGQDRSYIFSSDNDDKSKSG